jgi:hypothetical protein
MELEMLVPNHTGPSLQAELNMHTLLPLVHNTMVFIGVIVVLHVEVPAILMAVHPTVRGT